MFSSYQRLSKHQRKAGTAGEEEEAEEGLGQEGFIGGSGRGRGWLRLRRSSSRRRWWRRRPTVRVLGLSRFQLGKKVRKAVGKVVERFKEGRAHFGELFAGNYVFMQVNPSLSYLEKSIMAASHGLPPPSSRLFLRGVA